MTNYYQLLIEQSLFFAGAFVTLTVIIVTAFTEYQANKKVFDAYGKQLKRDMDTVNRNKPLKIVK